MQAFGDINYELQDPVLDGECGLVLDVDRPTSIVVHLPHEHLLSHDKPPTQNIARQERWRSQSNTTLG